MLATQQIVIDTQDLSDIPEYGLPMKPSGLLRYPYTARDVSTGLLFLGYSNELGLSYATLFAHRILNHLHRCGCDLSQTTGQSDNGSEFIGSWQSKHPSAFTATIESIPGQQHRTIPPGQHRFQADVETVHSLMEHEFYEIDRFSSREDFLEKANSYLFYFHVARRNSYKENKTPWELLQEKHHSGEIPSPDLNLPLFPVLYLNELHTSLLHKHSTKGYDVPTLP